MTNCPPVYRNIQCESFGNKRKITSQMLRQFCKNDAYLKEQIDLLWDTTDPESKKRFYPPDYMDVENSFGIMADTISTTHYDIEFFKYFQEVYNFSNITRFKYYFDFDVSTDKESEIIKDSDETHYMKIYSDSLLDLENSYDLEKMEIVRQDITIDGEATSISTLRPVLVTGSYREIVHHEEEYTTNVEKIKTKEATKGKYVTKKKEQLGKAHKDAYYFGAYNNWDCNNHWYNGFDRTKNYSIKSAWKKDPYGEDAKIVKKYGRIPSVCHSQTFKPQSSGRISKISLNIQGDKNAVSPCVVEIRTTSKKGYPTSKVLARCEKRFSGTGENIVAFQFKDKPYVKKGETYAIVVRSPFSHFNKTYRLGGWTTGCFSSDSKYYGDGSAFTSVDNGHTWVKNGKTKDTKGYGSHYYDWGINQKPVDFAFEVYIQPITQKAIKKKVKGKKAVYEYKTYQQLEKEAYDEVFTYEFTYFREGSYYIHLKPLRCNPIDWFNISSTFVTEQRDGTFKVSYSSEYWTWEYYDSTTSTWKEVGNNIVELDNTRTNLSVLKLRVRCDIDKNTFGKIVQQNYSSGANYTPTPDEQIFANLLASNKISEDFLTYLKNVEITVGSRLPSTAYLRTKYYHPNKTDMLGASLWSEVGAIAKTYGDAQLQIDVIHERDSIEHFQFIDLLIINSMEIGSNHTYSEKQYEIFNKMIELITLFEGEDPNYNTGVEIIQYVYNDHRGKGEFLKFLKQQLVPIYLLPIMVDRDGTGAKPYNLFDTLQLAHSPSYPLSGGDVGDDDIIIDIDDFTYVSDAGFVYPLSSSIAKTLSSILVTYKTYMEVDTQETIIDGQRVVLTTDEEGFELNDIDRQENIEETLKGIVLNEKLAKGETFQSHYLDGNNGLGMGFFKNGDKIDTKIDYAITNDGMYIAFNSFSPVIRELFPDMYDVNVDEVVGNIGDVTLKSQYSMHFPNSFPKSGTTVTGFEMKIDLTTKTYQEFVDFEVNYDTAEITFYNQTSLLNGDFKVRYNPLWVRGLSVADFPLKMDLWKEEYVIGVKTIDEKNVDGIYKMKFNTNNGEDERDTFYQKTNINPLTKVPSTETSYYTFKTTVPPLDNIRKLVINEDTNDERVLEEDSQFFVDYMTNTVTFYINDLVADDTITIHYTPNLTDNGLALGYRLKRPRYITEDGQKVEVFENDERYLYASPKDEDYALLGMNYFTYRT